MGSKQQIRIFYIRTIRPAPRLQPLRAARPLRDKVKGQGEETKIRTAAERGLGRKRPPKAAPKGTWSSPVLMAIGLRSLAETRQKGKGLSRIQEGQQILACQLRRPRAKRQGFCGKSMPEYRRNRVDSVRGPNRRNWRNSLRIKGRWSG